MINKFSIHDINKDENNVFVFSPNFEERSIGGFIDLLDEEIFTNQSGVISITLQARKPKEILDEIKTENSDFINKILAEKKIKNKRLEIKYPILEYKNFTFEIIDFCKSVSNNINLFLDITSMPRNIIFRFFDILFNSIKGDKIVLEKLTINSLNFIYTPAKSYPNNVNIELLGKIIGIYSERSFHRLLIEYGMVELIIFLSGNSHDAAQTYSLTNENKIASNIDKHIMIYLNEDNLRFSYNKIAENIGVISQSLLSNDKMDYIFNYEHMAISLYNKIQLIYERHKQMDSLLAIGAFGPKPVSLCSYLAKVRYEHVMKKSSFIYKGEVLTTDFSQYTSIYSHGREKSTIFNIDIKTIFA